MEVCDHPSADGSKCDTATINITVTPVNDPPVANDKPVETPEDTPVLICVSADDPVDSDPVRMTTTSCQAEHGDISGLTDGDLCFTYTPDQDYYGGDSVCLIVCDVPPNPEKTL